jgi:hypothetical protein
MCTELTGPRQKTNKLLLHSFKYQPDFKIWFQIEDGQVFFLKEIMHQPRSPQLHHHQVWLGAPP